MARGKKGSGKKSARGRRSKAESMTGAKESAVEVRTIGDNSSLALVAPDDYAHHYKSIKGLKEKSATASSLVRHAKTAANKACPGLAASIEQTIAIEREGDPEKLKRHLELMGIGLKNIGSTVQITIFDTLEGDEEDLIAKRGYEDGKAARTPNNKYPVGSDLDLLYTTNYQRGQAENLGVDLSKEPASELAAAE